MVLREGWSWVMCSFMYYMIRNYAVYRGNGVAQLVERRTQGPVDFMTRVRTPSGAQEKLGVFPSQKCCADSLLVCPTPVCIRIHENDHVRTLKIL